MQSKSLKRPLIILYVAGIVFSAAFFLFLTNTLSSRDSYAKQTMSIQSSVSAEQVASGLPARLSIPKIDVNAAIESVGLTPQGAMDVPKSPADVAWFNLGPRPGDIGSAVIAGHYGWKNNIPAAFDNLSDLQKGDKIYIKDDKGITVIFAVRESRRFGENEDASVVFGSGDGKAHLNLVTCEGVWNKDSKSYSKRLVVFADRE